MKTHSNGLRLSRRGALRTLATAALLTIAGPGHAAPNVQEQRDDIRETAP